VPLYQVLNPCKSTNFNGIFQPLSGTPTILGPRKIRLQKTLSLKPFKELQTHYLNPILLAHLQQNWDLLNRDSPWNVFITALPEWSQENLAQVFKEMWSIGRPWKVDLQIVVRLDGIYKKISSNRDDNAYYWFIVKDMVLVFHKRIKIESLKPLHNR